MPKQVDHASRRLELAAAAVDVIADKGIDNLRLVDVARQVGGTTGLVTHYLGDKEAVLLAALAYVADELIWHEQDDMSINSSIDSSLQSADDLRDFLYEVLPIDEVRRRQWTVWLAFWSRATTSQLLAETHCSYNQTFRQQLVKTITRLKLHAQPLICADLILTTMDGIAANATVEPQYWTAARQKQQLYLLLEAILKPQKH